MVERIQRGSETHYLSYISSPGGMIAIHISDNAGRDEMKYVLTDYLGTIYALVDDAAQSTDDALYYSFNAWGERRELQAYDGSLTAPLFSDPADYITSRGYTGHEHIDAFDLINMNGRAYDPVVGAFLSPDPYVQAPGIPQNLNRYSYVLNNPLKYSDPSGEWIFAAIGFIVGAYIGSSIANNDWNPFDGGWTLGNTIVGGVLGGLAGSLGAGLLFESGGLLSGGALNINLGFNFQNTVSAFANFTVGNGSAALEYLGYSTIAGGGLLLGKSGSNPVQEDYEARLDMDLYSEISYNDGAHAIGFTLAAAYPFGEIGRGISIGYTWGGDSDGIYVTKMKGNGVLLTASLDYTYYENLMYGKPLTTDYLEGRGGMLDFGYKYLGGAFGWSDDYLTGSPYRSWTLSASYGFDYGAAKWETETMVMPQYMLNPYFAHIGVFEIYNFLFK